MAFCVVAALVAIPLGAAPAPDSKLLASFRAACAAKADAADRAATMAVAGTDGWLFFAGELRHLAAGPFWGGHAAAASRADRPDQADPLPAILDFKAQLDRLGVGLVVVPVPAKAAIYPDRLVDDVPAGPGGPPRLDAADAAFLGVLREKGVTVVDLAPAMLANRAGAGDPAFCRQDTHWSGAGCILAARAIADAAKDRPGVKDAPRRKFESETKRVEVAGDLWQALAGDRPAKEALSLRFVGTRAEPGGELTPTEPDPASPVLLMGDSHNLIFHQGGDMLAEGAGLPDQLALELGFPVDVIAARGAGATASRVNLLRRVQADPDYLKSKKLVVWCFATREFTQSPGWQKVPLQ